MPCLSLWLPLASHDKSVLPCVAVKALCIPPEHLSFPTTQPFPASLDNLLIFCFHVCPSLSPLILIYLFIHSELALLLSPVSLFQLYLLSTAALPAPPTHSLHSFCCSVLIWICTVSAPKSFHVSVLWLVSGVCLLRVMVLVIWTHTETEFTFY